MPTLVTREAYACLHSLDTHHQTLGTDDSVEVEIETVPIPSQCPDCVYDSLLEGCRELDAYRNDHDDSSASEQPTLTDEERVAEFAKYLLDLVEKKRCALLAAYGAGYVPEF
ncbi:uncharacterized protein F4807DRAFT_463218 [Annulohypoxylon truncatum]|uniref:uncharacterized protein n=1 Tax=Annulohypoxylon truncatum TaxID=327061 RepID=UPI0020089C02|nr:uncharacterized protein F4807DRAFT_463218 [Annulohypoxylon truncatum]KAI1206817.1 hypothetical protein F4807DRAFT_463218 [Annulohypoxylon truncatum]